MGCTGTWRLIDLAREREIEVHPGMVLSFGAESHCDVHVEGSGSLELELAFEDRFVFGWHQARVFSAVDGVEIAWGAQRFQLCWHGGVELALAGFPTGEQKSPEYRETLVAAQMELGSLAHSGAPELECVVRNLHRFFWDRHQPWDAAHRRVFIRTALAVWWQICEWGVLTPLMRDPSVDEIMVNGDGAVFVERGGLLERTAFEFGAVDELHAVIERAVRRCGRRLDAAQPFCDARLPDGSRLNVVLPPLSVRGACLTIRKFSRRPFSAPELVQMGMISESGLELVARWVRERRNLLVCGGTGAGKTSFLNAIASFIRLDERIVTIEDSAELRLSQPHVVPLECRVRNAEGAGEITIRELVRNALRMRPDRIIVGECRGGEALDMLQAMNTGHSGSLTTLHANGASGALRRLETLVMLADTSLPLAAIREQIVSAIGGIVHIERDGAGRRRIVEISSVEGLDSATGGVRLSCAIAWNPREERWTES